MRLWNLAHAVRGGRERYFIHPHAQVNGLMAEAGFANAHEGGIRAWRVVLYRRASIARNA
jgi:hypothetical protein